MSCTMAFTPPLLLRPYHSVQTPLTPRRPPPPRRAAPRRAARTTANLTESSDNADEEHASPPPEAPFPQLYDAWFPPTNELATQMQAAITAAYDANHRYLELQWPTVPNLEEIAAGTKLNFEFGKHISQYLGMTSAADYMLIKRYLAQFANLYWTILVAECTPFKSRTVWAVFSDGVTKTSATARLQNVQLASMRRPPEAIGEDDVVVIVDPRATEAWKRGLKMKPKNGCVVFLNSQFNESYGLTGPRNGDLKHVEGVYFLKRVTRGYAFRAFPGAWRACLERPDLVVEEVGRFEKLPSLREIAGIVRETSNQRYGGLYNDRYVKGFGGRL